MAIQLKDILWPEGRNIEICCGACGRRLGKYFLDDLGSSGRIVLTDGKGRHSDPTEVTGNPADRAQGLDFGPRTGAASYSESESGYQWRCGCGATPQRRADRFGRLDVDERFDPPRVYVH